MEAGKLSLDPIEFDLSAKIDDIMRLLAPRAEEKKIRLAHSVAADVPARLIGDPGRWRQIVVNLVGNAIKFTEQGEVVVRVELGTRHSDGDTLHVSVSDTGIGIPDKQAGSDLRLILAGGRLHDAQVWRYRPRPLHRVAADATDGWSHLGE